MSRVSSSILVKSLVIPNRILRSATMENMADQEGFVTDKLLALYRELARGGTGLIVTGAAAVEAKGRLWSHQLSVWDDKFLGGLSSLAAVFREEEAGCKSAVQLHHRGAAGLGYSYGNNTNSFSLNDLTDAEITATIESFSAAARRVRDAGFDAVAVHAAHGYLISQFLTPVTNKRTDKWGGTPEKRVRFAVEVCRAIRHNVGDEMPVLWKMNCDDYLPEGQGVEQYRFVAKMLAQEGVDLFEISGGLKEQIKLRNFLKDKSGQSEAYFIKAISSFREAVGDKALCLTGGIRSLAVMEDLLSQGVDFLGLCRPLICEPDLASRYLASDDPTAISSSYCNSCNQCLLTIANEPLFCARANRH